MQKSDHCSGAAHRVRDGTGIGARSSEPSSSSEKRLGTGQPLKATSSHSTSGVRDQHCMLAGHRLSFTVVESAYIASYLDRDDFL